MAEWNSMLIPRVLDRKSNSVVIVAVILVYCCMIQELLMAQSVEQMQPSYVHTALYGVVAVETGDLYAAGTNSTLLRSTDQGASWSLVALGDHRMHFRKLVTDGADLYLLAASAISAGHHELWPDGYSWSLFRFDTQAQSLSHVPYPLFEVTINDRLYEFGHADLVANSAALYLTYCSADGKRSRLLRSRDKGVHWSDLGIPDSTSNEHCFLYTQPDGDDLVVYQKYHPDNNLYLSTDGGESWKTRSSPDTHLSSIAYLGEGYMLAQSSETNGILISDSTGTWEHRGFPPFSKISSATFVERGELYVCSTDGGVFRSEDDGASWVMLKPELKASRLDHYQYSCTMLGTDIMVAVNTHGNIIVTQDGGLSWNEPRYRPEIFSYVRMADALHGYVHLRNTDEGYSYNLLTRDGFETLEPFPVYPLSEPAIQSPATWYSIGYYGLHSDSLVCVSRDGGVHWELVFQRPGITAYASEIDVADSSSYAVVTSDGLYFTEDQGQTWSHILSAGWSNKNFPQRVVVPDTGPVWLLTGAGSLSNTSFSIFRSDSTRRSWDTVYVIPDSLRYVPGTSSIGTTWGFEDLCVLPDGGVYATYFRDVPEINRDELHVLYSSDLGATWQHWTTKTPVSEYLTIGNAMGPDAAILANGGMLTDVHGEPQNLILPMQLLASTDGMGNAQVILDHALTVNVDNTSYIEKADENTAYYVTGSAIFRITFPEVTSVQSPKPPPLPLSIAVPYPQPVSPNRVVYIEIDVPIQGRVLTEVFDMLGRRRAIVFDGEIEAGERILNWTPAGLERGLYMLNLRTAHGAVASKIIIQ